VTALDLADVDLKAHTVTVRRGKARVSVSGDEGHEDTAWDAVPSALESGQQAPPQDDQLHSPDAWRPRCQFCSSAIPPKRGKLAKWCSNACRQKAWKARVREKTGQAASTSPRHPARSQGVPCNPAGHTGELWRPSSQLAPRRDVPGTRRSLGPEPCQCAR
jgi:hypothetical protein